jgi:hypothetical protein
MDISLQINLDSHSTGVSGNMPALEFYPLAGCLIFSRAPRPGGKTAIELKT